ncbi:MAG: hypothetical protein HC842_05525 [Cytophagales bacterium]|nr:hypothetical protein [Cytophagales bacterium]
MKKILLFPLFVLFGLPSVFPQSAAQSDVYMRKVRNLNNTSARIGIDHVTHTMYYVITTDKADAANGEIYKVTKYFDKTVANATNTKVADKTHHGITEQISGLDVYDGFIYIAGSIESGNNIKGIIKKASLSQGATLSTWITVAETENYLKSNTAFDHRLNFIAIDPAGQYIYANSGSRTDHGEEHLNEREVELTSKILRIPLNSTNLLLKNNPTDLAPYVYVHGIRNAHGLAINSRVSSLVWKIAATATTPRR